MPVDRTLLSFHRQLEMKLEEIERILAPLKMGHKLTLIARATTAPTGDGDIVLTVEKDIQLALDAAKRTYDNPTVEVPARFDQR